MTTTTTQTVRDMADTQTVVPAWVHDMASEHGWDAQVQVTRRVTAFGTWVTNVAVV